MHHFWASQLKDWTPGHSFFLEEEESHHGLEVLRIRPGEEIGLLDGLGRIGIAEAEASAKNTKKKMSVFLKSCSTPEHGPLISVAGPAPQGKRLPYMLEKLQEIGVSRWTALETERGERHSFSSRHEKLIPRLRETCKQCGNPWLMEVAGPVALEEAISRPGAAVLHMSGKRLDELPDIHGGPDCGERLLLYGPEGDWSERELALFRKTGLPVLRLGPHVMRMETAAVVGAGAMMGRMG